MGLITNRRIIWGRSIYMDAYAVLQYIGCQILFYGFHGRYQFYSVQYVC